MPTDLKRKLETRLVNKRREWLAGGGEWPMTFGLGEVSQNDAYENLAAVRAWIDVWSRWRGPGTVGLAERRWNLLSDQDLPKRIVFTTAGDIAEFVGQGNRWREVESRYQDAVLRWPKLAPALLRHCAGAVQDYNDSDWKRLLDVTQWLVEHPRSGMYARQLPIRGIHSKWVESRSSVIRDFVSCFRDDSEDPADFFEACGLARAPGYIHLCILDPVMRQQVGGLRLLSAPTADVARLPIQPMHVLIIENLHSGLSLPDIPHTIAILRLGYGVEPLSDLPWVRTASCWYWGDLDSHGFAILSAARRRLPHLTSILMDAATLAASADLIVQEDDGKGSPTMELLHEPEIQTFLLITGGAFGAGARLEQERLPWDNVMQTISAVLAPPERSRSG